MAHPKPDRDELRVEHGVFRGLLLFAAVALALWAFWLIFKPFIIPIAWALCLAALTALPHRWLLARWNKPRLVALVMTLLVLVVVLTPIVLLSFMLVLEATEVDFQPLIDEVKVQFPTAYRALTDWLGELGELGLFDTADGRQVLEAFAISVRENLPDIVRAFLSGPLAGGALSLIGAPFFFLFEFLIALVTLYFVYRESGRLRRLMVDISPLSAKETDQILESLRSTTNAAILGGILVAVIQGGLGGAMFWVAGIASPFFWAVVMAFFSLLPFGGTALIWVPVAVYQFLVGEIGSGVFLMVFGTVIVGAADNVLRPWILYRTGARDIHPMLLFFAILSGIGLFGISGIVFGPLLLALLTTMLRIYRRHFATGGQAEESGLVGEPAPAVD